MKTILIDLDGTIINSMQGVTKSVQHALKYFNIEIDDLNQLRKHIGPPLKEGFMQYYNMSSKEADKAIEEYRVFYKSQGINMNELYDGIGDMLMSLRNLGYKLIVATSKPETFARKILEDLEIAEKLDDICGASLDGSRSDKADVIRYALDKHGITDIQSVVMVGDTKYDIEGAKEVGIPSIGVLYGFGEREELEAYGANYIVENVEELRNLLVKLYV